MSHFDYEQAAIVLATHANERGLRVGAASHSQRYSVVRRGFSCIYFSLSGVRGRREGLKTPSAKTFNEIYPEKLNYQSPGYLDACLAILATGRTVECGPGVNLREISKRIPFETIDYKLNRLANVVRAPDFPWDLDPDYQRGSVWTERQRELFLGHLLENGRTPLIWINESRQLQNEGLWQVLDGKQRLTTCLMFLDGDIAAELSDSRRIWYRDFDEVDRRSCPSIKVALVKLNSRADVLRFYLKLNRGGTVHTDAEISRVRDLLEAEVKLLPQEGEE